MKVLRAAWMRELDEQTIQRIGIPSIVLMENAARGAASVFAAHFPVDRYPAVLVLAGKGHNGGDGLAVARLLHHRGYEVEIALLADPAALPPDAALNLRIARQLELPLVEISSAAALGDRLRRHARGGAFLVDGLFGTGLARPLREGLFAEAIGLVNESGLPVAAIDIPSGLSEEFPPEAGEHLRAAVTAALHALKLAHIHPDGNRHCGCIHVVDIGIPPRLTADPRFDIEWTDPAAAAGLFAPRPVDAHKGRFGHVLSVVGSEEKPGAGILAAYAALRAGAGLSSAAVSPANRCMYVQAHPEVMVIPYRRPDDLLPRLGGFACILAGPGLGDGDDTQAIVSMLLQNARSPLVLDADALNALGRSPGLLQLPRRAPLVLTPHPGEFARLAGETPERVRNGRIALAREFARAHDLCLVLKGHHTVVAAPQGALQLNPTGNPGMATAGAGDVLAGVIAGLIAQSADQAPLPRIVAAAVLLHGHAGDLAAARVGETALTAGDILDLLPDALRRLDDVHLPFRFA